MELRTVRTTAELHDFVHLPFRLYAGDAAWVPPLIAREKKRLDPSANPFFRRAERELFLAVRGRQVVGRVAAIHDRTRGDGAGTFGFLECEDDREACGALLAAADEWLRQRGLRRVVGPINLSAFEESGVLVSGHDRRPPFMAAHHPPFYSRLLEELGYEKERDTLAYERTLIDAEGRLATAPEGLTAAAAAARADVTIRPVRLDRWDEEIDRACDVLNASFTEVEGHVAVSHADFAALARQFRAILDPRILLFAEHQGRVVGFALLLPDVNEVLAHLGGRLFPLGWLKGWWHGRRVQTVSFKLAGVLPELRKSGLAARLALEASLTAQSIGYRRMEMSVVNESNRRMRDFIELQGASPYLRYRLYRRELA